ncbi:hypothetical protein D6779_09885 [Candidatus Parcubacteria bacterium]|nr:MAG: hypothetical protein D6779_09885 [Candidatus Parcubacteria bacterium]
MTLIERFGGVFRMLAIGWGTLASNLYPRDSLGRLVKSENPPDEKRTEGEITLDPLDCMVGLTKTERRAQAALIRKYVEDILSQSEVALIDLKMIPLDGDLQRKQLSLSRVVKSLTEITDYPPVYLMAVCQLWGGFPIEPRQLIEASGKSASTEHRWRRAVIDALEEAFDFAVAKVRRGLK